MSIRSKILTHTTIDENGCWIWLRGGIPDGYGTLNKNGKSHLVHRLAYEEWISQIPDGLCVLHRCDVRRCCNPKHLFVGTNADNVADRVAKGREGDRRGSKHGMARINEQDVIDIRNSSESSKFLADKYGLKPFYIWQIRVGKAWKHVAMPSTEQSWDSRFLAPFKSSVTGPQP